MSKPRLSMQQTRWLALRAGTSEMTVRRRLAGRRVISPAVERAVDEALRELGVDPPTPHYPALPPVERPEMSA